MSKRKPKDDRDQPEADVLSVELVSVDVPDGAARLAKAYSLILHAASRIQEQPDATGNPNPYAEE